MKKGQAAMEFLMTYGWALLVVVIAIAALAFFGLLNPSRFLPPKCDLSAGISCVDYSAVSGTVPMSTLEDGEISIIINNGIGTTMRNVEIIVRDCEDDDNNLVPMSSKYYALSKANFTNFTHCYKCLQDPTYTGGGIECESDTSLATFGCDTINQNTPNVAEGQSQIFKIPCGGMPTGSKFRSDLIIKYNTTVEGFVMNHTRTGAIVLNVERVQ
ncbi:MAG: hypothetical protein ACMXYG_05825 [Candidatus Woesearchaeota archaeon]